MKLAFTDKALRELVPPTTTAQAFYNDTKQTGLQYVVGRGGTGTFYAVYRRNGEKKRDALGRYGDDMSLPEARKAVQAVLGRVAEDKATPGDVRRANKNGLTLAEATNQYLAKLKNDGRPSSIKTVETEIADPKKSYVKTWLDRPLRSIPARECRECHERISKEHGPHVANRVLRNLRTIWNYVVREEPEDNPWPANFTRSVNWHSGVKEGYVDRRQEPILWAHLPNWRIAVEQLTPMRRDYQLFVLLTGLRRTDACTVRDEHLNLGREPVISRVWHIGKQAFEDVELAPESLLRPMPKGGAAKAFTIPLSPPLVEILQRRRDENRAMGRDGGWIFPSQALRALPCVACQELGLGPHTVGAAIHMKEPKERPVEIPGPEGTPIKFKIPSPHRLRDTYLTGGREAGVSERDLKLLVNHTYEQGGVTARYQRPDVEYLRTCQIKVTDYLLSRMTPRRGRDT